LFINCKDEFIQRFWTSYRVWQKRLERYLQNAIRLTQVKNAVRVESFVSQTVRVRIINVLVVMRWMQIITLLSIYHTWEFIVLMPLAETFVNGFSNYKPVKDELRRLIIAAGGVPKKYL